MTRSSITSKYQTTVPKEVRQRLGVGPSDHLVWDVLGPDTVQVKVAHRSFLKRRGSIEVGRGSVVEDLERARATRGTESP